MSKDFPEQRIPNDRQRSEFAETAEVGAADRTLLESATAEAARDPKDRRTDTPPTTTRRSPAFWRSPAAR